MTINIKYPTPPTPICKTINDIKTGECFLFPEDKEFYIKGHEINVCNPIACIRVTTGDLKWFVKDTLVLPVTSYITLEPDFNPNNI